MKYERAFVIGGVALTLGGLAWGVTSLVAKKSAPAASSSQSQPVGPTDAGSGDPMLAGKSRKRPRTKPTSGEDSANGAGSLFGGLENESAPQDAIHTAPDAVVAAEQWITDFANVFSE
jgi:hypothetical protein